MTTKMDALREAFAANHSEWKGYEERARQIVGEFRRQTAKYLECGIEDIRLLSVSDENTFDNFRKLDGARSMWLDNDAWWHFALQFVMEWQPPIPGIQSEKVPNKWVILALAIKPQDDDSFVAAVPSGGRNIVVKGDDFAELVDSTYLWIKRFLETDFRDFVEGVTTQKASIGF